MSIGAEAGISHPITMLDGGFFLPLSGNKPPDLSGAIGGGCHQVASIGTETGIGHPIRMLEGAYILVGQNPCFG